VVRKEIGMRRVPPLILATATVLAALAAPARATDGYFSHGYGTHYKGIAGAGVALHLDSLAAATNPAAMVFLGPRFDASLALFSPDRYYSVTGNPSGYPGTFGLTPGEVRSDSRAFPVPALGANWKAGENGTFGLSLYGNGGMNTDWPTGTFYAGTPTGVNLSQMFVAPTYAVKLGGKHALGLTAIGAMQWFKAEGVASFAPFSSDPAMLSNNGYSYSFGGGLRVGYLGDWSRYLSVGASYQTKVWMSAFDEYAGLFAENGRFDVPANWVAGIAIHPTDEIDVALDVQQVFYSKVASVGNGLMPNLMQSPLGSDGGAGFGWSDMTTVKGGVQLRSGEGWAWRGGYSYGKQPIPSSEVLFNILAPGIIEQQLTLGFSKAVKGTQEISVSVLRAFTKKLSGPNPLEVPGLQSIELRMSEWDFEIGWSFGIHR
jgi:long-chain fatty acid transport protein